MIARLVIAFSIWHLPFAIAPLSAATCSGADPCTACHDCSRCEFCAVQKKGSCGVCRNQTDAERQKARKQKARKMSISKVPQ